MVITPHLVVGGTDAKYYAGRSQHVFRFLPVFLKSADIVRVHGTDERLAIESFANSIRFFHLLLMRLDAL